MSTAWTAEELASIDRAKELRVAGRRADGSPRTPVIVWHVVVGSSLYIRSIRGEKGSWYRGTQTFGDGRIECAGTTTAVTFTRDDSHDKAVNRAYWSKYRWGLAVWSMTRKAARSTTLRVERQFSP